MTVESIDRFADRYDDPLRDELVDLLRATSTADELDGPRPHVWDHIEAAISERDADATASATLPAPTPISVARRRRTRRTIGRVAAIAAAVSFVGGAALAALGPLSSREAAPAPTPEVASPSVEAEARRAADRTGARIVQLTDVGGAPTVDVVVLPDGSAYVLGSQLPDGDAPYQLYALVGETRVLLGTLLGDGAVRLERIPAGALLIALVDEAGAVVAGAPVATSDAPAAPDAPLAVGGAASPSSEVPAPASPAPFTPPPGAPSFPSPSGGQPNQAPPPPPDGVIDLPLFPPIRLPLFG